MAMIYDNTRYGLFEPHKHILERRPDLLGSGQT
jgi:hypothetical protein